MRSRGENNHGFTLLETMGAVLIATLFLTVSIAGTNHLIDLMALETEQNRIFQDIKYTKMEAITTESHAHISFPYFTPRDYYIISSPIQGGQRKDLPDGIEFSTIRTGFGGFNPSIRFSPDGTPWGGATIGIVNNRGQTRYIIVAAISGRVRKSKTAPGN